MDTPIDTTTLERHAHAVLAERRHGPDRRKTTARTFIQGSLTPRRRHARRADERHQLVDWHEPHLLFLSVMILMLSVADAFLTLTLLTVGATEANPFLAYILDEHPKLFAAVKLGLTGVGVLVLVAVARAPLFRVMRAGTVMHWLLAGYVALIVYEWRLLHSVL